MSDARRILLYGDMDLRYTDGSAVWLTSMARALTATQSRVSLLLKSARGTGGLFSDLASIDGLDVIDDFSSKLVRGPRYQAPMAARRIEYLVTERQIDVVICRGFAACMEVVRQPNAGRRLWAYMTDIPQRSEEMTAQRLADFTEIAHSAQRLFAQTEEAREFLEFHVPAARRKTLLLPPMLPDALHELSPKRFPVQQRNPQQTLKLVYAGKFARSWNTLEMCDLPRRAASLQLDVQLTMIGDKFQQDPDDVTWAPRMKAAIGKSPGVHWLGGMSRRDTLREVARHDNALAWRGPELDSSHEMSTKLLEYLACGVPPLVNRTTMHEALLGNDYPLFVDRQDILKALRQAAFGDFDLPEMLESTRAAVQPYWISSCADALEIELSRADAERTNLPGPVQIVLAGSDSFCERATSALGSQGGIQTKRYIANRTQLPVPDASMFVVQASSLADCLPEGTPAWIVWDSTARAARSPLGKPIAGVLVADPSDRLQAARWADLPVGRVFVLPEITDMTASRPKTAGAEFTVAVLVESSDPWAVKEAHQVLSILRAENPRFTLRLLLPSSDVYSAQKWEREMMLDAISDLAADPQTMGAWSPVQTADSSTWLREVGWLTGSRPTTIRETLGRSAGLSGAVELRALSEANPAVTTQIAQRVLDAVACGKWETASLRTIARHKAFPPSHHQLQQILASATV